MRLRFTIRDLLWLTALVALAVGWWLDRRNVAQQRDNYYSQLKTPPTVQYIYMEGRPKEN
jgi:uncharacterized membrane-anchored protein